MAELTSRAKIAGTHKHAFPVDIHFEIKYISSVKQIQSLDGRRYSAQKFSFCPMDVNVDIGEIRPPQSLCDAFMASANSLVKY